MKNEFIAKFGTRKYLIGSFDVYLEESFNLTKTNMAISKNKTNEIITSMPTQYRAAIVERNGNYLGYIGIYDIDMKESTTSLLFCINKRISKKDYNSIINSYTKWIKYNIGIHNIERTNYITPKTHKTTIIKTNINISRELLRSDFLLHEIPSETLEKFKKQYEIPNNMTFPCQIIKDNKTLGIMFLTKVLWTNKRGTLNIFLDKNEIENNKQTIITAINDYLNYTHNKKIYNINTEIDYCNTELLNIIRDTDMNYYAIKPLSKINNGKINSLLLFEHTPNMTKAKKTRLPNNIIKDISIFDTPKKELDKIITVNKDYKMVSPKVFKENNIDFENVLQGHIKAMQVRSRFTIPLGEDKYMLQKGNEKYGLYKQLNNFTYIVLDKNNNYIGFVSLLIDDYKNRNAEVEIGITPKMQRHGIGTKVLRKLMQELFSTGYACVISTIFKFNKASTKMHKKTSSVYCGARKGSYYANGKYWDMTLYIKTNPKAFQKTSE